MAQDRQRWGKPQGVDRTPSPMSLKGSQIEALERPRDERDRARSFIEMPFNPLLTIGFSGNREYRGNCLRHFSVYSYFQKPCRRSRTVVSSS